MTAKQARAIAGIILMKTLTEPEVTTKADLHMLMVECLQDAVARLQYNQQIAAQLTFSVQILLETSQAILVPQSKTIQIAH